MLGHASQPTHPKQDSVTSSKTRPETFDVISVKPSAPNSGVFTTRPNPDNFMMTGATLKFLVQYAYGVHDFQVEEASSWMASTRFDVFAKMDPVPNDATASVTDSQDWRHDQKLVETRLQSLLADRFGLRLHKTTSDRPIYILVIAKGGPKLHAAKTNTGYSASPGQLICSYSSMDNLAALLADATDRIVVDGTKLPGAFSFTLRWSRDDIANTVSNLPGLFTALTEQLGLKLQSAKGPVELLVIDRATLPSSN